MTDRYAAKRRRVAARLRQWSTGTVTLTRTTPGAPDVSKPWIPGEATLDVYALDARVDGVAAEYVNGTTILASDLMVIASPKATHTLSGGVSAGDVAVSIVPRQSDTLQIDGVPKTIKKIEAVPAAGLAARFHIFVAS